MYAGHAPELALSDVTLLPAIPDPGKVLCVGVVGVLLLTRTLLLTGEVDAAVLACGKLCLDILDGYTLSLCSSLPCTVLTVSCAQT